jgi:nucleotidyltransferase substrate binding protein (TIGR01987 family)
MKYKKFYSYKKSVQRLKEVLREDKTETIRDSAIKRFEFCFELAWKSVQEFLRDKGITCMSPKDCFKGAFKYGLIEDNPLWVEMIEDRNLAIHTYEERLAENLYNKLESKYLPLFVSLLKSLDIEKDE